MHPTDGPSAPAKPLAEIVIPGFVPGQQVDRSAFQVTHGYRPGQDKPPPLVTRGPGDGVLGARPNAKLVGDGQQGDGEVDGGPSWTKPPEVVVVGAHPRIRRDSGAWSGRKAVGQAVVGAVPPPGHPRDTPP